MGEWLFAISEKTWGFFNCGEIARAEDPLHRFAVPLPTAQAGDGEETVITAHSPL